MAVTRMSPRGVWFWDEMVGNLTMRWEFGALSFEL